MCKKYNCPQAINCYRLRALTDKDQLDMYDTFPGICNEEDNYQMFMKIRPDDKIVDWIEPIAIETSINTKEETKQEEGEDNLIAK